MRIKVEKYLLLRYLLGDNMVSRIQFNLPEPLLHLLLNEKVYTVRTTRRNPVTYANVRTKLLPRTKIARAIVSRVCKFSYENIEKYYENSGFKSPDDWMSRIRSMYKRPGSLIIYEVSIIRWYISKDEIDEYVKILRKRICEQKSIREVVL